jgi:hypothetical protein
MKTKFDRYIEEKLTQGNYENLFYPWDFDRIFKESKQWRMPARWLFVYVIVNRSESKTSHACWVGCTSNLDLRLLQYNGLKKGGPSKTKNGNGNCKIMIYFVVPPFRNYSAKTLKAECKRGRGWQNKCKAAMMRANSMGLVWKISRELTDPKSDLFVPFISDFVANMGPNADVYM